MPVTHRIAAIPGDGIGTEVLPTARRVLDRAGERSGFVLDWTELDWSCEYYSRTGRMMPADGLEQLAELDQIFLGAHPDPPGGDILTDSGAAIIGSIGTAPSANLNPEGEFPSMFEPVHGSAPDIAGQGRANPLGQVWAGAMMLDHLGHPGTAGAVMDAVAHVLGETGVRTPDLGGTASTTEVEQELLLALTRSTTAPQEARR